MDTILSVQNLTKTYASGHQALRAVTLQIRRGEIFALLGPNGAGKTTLIGISCGLVTPSSGVVRVDGHDVVRDFRAARETCARGFTRAALAATNSTAAAGAESVLLITMRSAIRKFASPG